MFHYMSLQEKIVFLVFTGLVAAVFGSALGLLIHGVYHELRQAQKKLSKRFLWLRRGTWGLAVIGLACIGYGYWIEPGRIEVSRFRLRTPKLPKGARGIRVVHITDLHCERVPHLENVVVGLITHERPDLIVFTGDAMNDRRALTVFRVCMRRLARVAPTVVVRGNWDVRQWKDVDLFRETKVMGLNGQAARIPVRGNDIWVAGAAWLEEENIDRALALVPKNALTVFAYHAPGGIYRIAEGNVDLCLVGHTHGGQVRLPWFGALVTLTRFGKRFEAGLYRVENTCLYVNRGIGMEGGLAPRVRFLCRPEIAVFEIVPEW